MTLPLQETRARTKSHEGLMTKVHGKGGWYQESAALLERSFAGESKGRPGHPRVFPQTFDDKHVYFPNLE